MSILETSDVKQLAVVADATKKSFKCRIPQRLSSHRQKVAYKPNTTSNIIANHPERPKSSNRIKDGTAQRKSGASRPERERVQTPQKKTSVTPYRIPHDITSNKSSRPVIRVPVRQNHLTKTLYTNRTLTYLPDQETINKHEEQELQQSDLTVDNNIDLNDTESDTSKKEKITQLKVNWQEKSVLFAKLKNDLNEKQKAITQLYASMGVTHKQMEALGQTNSLPALEELQIINVTNLSPQQLLQLCEQSTQLNEEFYLAPIAIEKLLDMPLKLVGTFEQTLLKNKEMIEELETLFTREKAINLNSLLKRFREYSGENKKLSYSFEDIKNKFFVELNDIVNFVRKSISERMALYLQIDKLNSDISELDSLKDDLRKQLQESDHRRCYVNKNKVEDLEKQLKEEKAKNSILKSRCSREIGQAKVNADNVSQLEAALEQSRSHCRSLERTIQQLQDQNQKLQEDFEEQFNIVSESIRENTVHLEEIAEAREKLQAEKEGLEKKLSEISDNYNELIKNMKIEMNMKIAEVIENERKYEAEKEERSKLVDKVESLSTQLLESELRYKELCKQLQDTKIELSKHLEHHQEAESMRHQLELANTQINKYHDKFAQQNKVLKEIQNNLKESLIMEESIMKCDLKSKEVYEIEIEKNVALLQSKQQDSETKMTSCEEQLSSLQYFTQFQDFDEFKNLNDLHDDIIQQRSKLLKATIKNRELDEALQKKEIELEQQLEMIAEHEHTIQHRDDIIKMLSDKEEEHAKIIKLLRNNLEMRNQADVDLHQQITEKNSEIDTLVANLDRRKQQISQLEKIILTLEDQTRNASTQRRNDQEKIKYLENKLNECETFHTENKRNVEPTEELDNIIKLLEDELISPVDPKQANKNCVNKKNCNGNNIFQNKVNEYDLMPQDPQSSVKKHNDITARFVVCYKNNREPYSRNIHNEAEFENLERQQYITNIRAENGAHNREINNCKTPPVSEIAYKVRRKDNNNLRYLTPPQIRDDKKSLKLYKIAGHKL